MLRFGQVPLGINPHEERSLEDISFEGNEIPDQVSDRLNEDDVLSLNESYGDIAAGDPSSFDFLRVLTTCGVEKDIEVFNIAILLFMDNREETRRLFRIINTIKDEHGGGGTSD